jgi:hypothetical protein
VTSSRTDVTICLPKVLEQMVKLHHAASQEPIAASAWVMASATSAPLSRASPRADPGRATCRSQAPTTTRADTAGSPAQPRVTLGALTRIALRPHELGSAPDGLVAVLVPPIGRNRHFQQLAYVHGALGRLACWINGAAGLAVSSRVTCSTAAQLAHVMVPSGRAARLATVSLAALSGSSR